MRLAMVTWSRRRAGGVETYVEHVLDALRQSGHEVALWFETEEPSDAAPIAVPPGTPTESLAASLDAAMAWQPDALIVNGLQNEALERRLLATRPTVYVAHNFDGTCISGKKSWSAPVERPCDRRLGAGCLAHYFPHRCGGLNPLTMVSRYAREHRRLEALATARRVVTLSEYMRGEYIRNGLDAARVVCVPYGGVRPDEIASASVERREIRGSLAFVGRLERLKGLHVLLEALPAIATAARRSITLTVLGDGPERAALERQARELTSTTASVAVGFEGRVGADVRDRHLADADLLVVPSLWPEPLGLVGLEAARLGVPAAAFDVGGIRQWLTPDVNGVVAPGNPPTADGLATAIAGALSNPERMQRLRHGALMAARAAATPGDHAAALVSLIASDRVAH